MKRTLVSAAVVTAIGVAVLVALSSRPAPPQQQRSEEPASQAAQPQPLGAQAARELLASGAVLVDVREAEELAASGKLEGALHVPMSRLSQLAAQGSVPPQLEAAKARPVILYCRSGRRSAAAGAILLGHGFERVYNLGGFEDAVKAGLPAA